MNIETKPKAVVRASYHTSCPFCGRGYSVARDYTWHRCLSPWCEGSRGFALDPNIVDTDVPPWLPLRTIVATAGEELREGDPVRVDLNGVAHKVCGGPGGQPQTLPRETVSPKPKRKEIVCDGSGVVVGDRVRVPGGILAVVREVSDERGVLLGMGYGRNDPSRSEFGWYAFSKLKWSAKNATWKILKKDW